MLYTEPKINISKFETIYASDKVPAGATASDLGYDVSVSYGEIVSGAAQNTNSVLGYIQ